MSKLRFIFFLPLAVPTAADNDEHSNWSYDFNTSKLMSCDLIQTTVSCDVSTR